MASTGMKTNMPVRNMCLQIAKKWLHSCNAKKRLQVHAWLCLFSLPGKNLWSCASPWSCGISGLWHWLLLCNAGTVGASLSQSLDFFLAKLENCHLWRCSKAGNSSDWQVQYWWKHHGHQKKEIAIADMASKMETVLVLLGPQPCQLDFLVGGN